MDLHKILYSLKRGDGPSEEFPAWLEDLASRNDASAIIFGCTELHLLHGFLAQRQGKIQGLRIVDPLLIVARDISKFSIINY